MSVLDDFEETKRQVAALAAAEARAEGEYRALTRQLKEEFGADTAKEGKKVRDELLTKELADAKAYLDAHRRFKADHAAELRKLDE